jgi:hypothetical protein
MSGWCTIRKPSSREKHILLVEDIVDTPDAESLDGSFTGTEPAFLRDLRPASQAHRRRAQVRDEVRGIRRTARVLVGYGLDHAESFRHIPYIASLLLNASANVAEKRQQEQQQQGLQLGALLQDALFWVFILLIPVVSSSWPGPVRATTDINYTEYRASSRRTTSRT